MIPTTAGPMEPEQIIDYLTYCSYRAQRELHGMSAERAMPFYTRMGHDGEAMEAQYQAEKAINNAARAGNDHSTAEGGDASAAGGTNTHEEK